MPPKKKVTSKTPNTKAYASGWQDEDEPEVVGDMYDDTFGLIEKGGEIIKGGNVYHVFKK